MAKNTGTVSRRRVLAGGVASGVLSASGLAAQTAPSRAAANLKVTVTLNGATYTYPNGPKIPSYYVGFRDDGRVVFHLGALGDLTKADAQPAPYHLGGHHVKIEDGDKAVFDADIPAHWWNAEWTYRPQPIAPKKTPAEIAAANRMFAYGDAGADRPPSNYAYKGPMDSAGITIYMPTTGERPDIGLITDPSAYYMMSGRPGPMIAWAQAAGSCPMHFRDEKTGKPIDLIKYPQANSNAGNKQGRPWLMPGIPDVKAPSFRVFGGGWEPQQAHYCEMSYLAHAATLDAGFLEDLQYSANFILICDAYTSGGRNMATVHGEYRGAAWAFRNLFMAHVATQDAEAAGALPASCHPASYWKKLLDNQLSYYGQYMADPGNQYYRLVCGLTEHFGPWQVDYMLMALAFGVLTGHSDWTPLYLWALKNVIDRTSGNSGYPVGWGGAYYLNTKPTWYEAFLDLKGQRDDGSTQAQIDALKSDPFNGGRAMTGAGYLMTTRAVLIMAACLDKKGLANVRKAYPELDKCISNVNRMVQGPVHLRTAVVL